MKKSIPIYILIVASVVFCAFTFINNKPEKIGCIDIIKILKKSTEMARINKEFEAKEKELNANLDTVMNEIKADISSFEKNIQEKNDKQKAEFSRLINNKQDQINGYREVNAEKLNQEKAKATQSILEKINGISEDIAIKQGYKVILGATGTGNIVYLDTKIDLTNEVIKRLND
jgi:outer membrane protein